MIHSMKLVDISDVNCTIHQLHFSVRNMFDSDEGVKTSTKRKKTHFISNYLKEIAKIQKE